MISESSEKTYGTSCFYFLLIKRATSLAKYPDKTGFNGVVCVLINLNNLSKS